MSGGGEADVLLDVFAFFLAGEFTIVRVVVTIYNEMMIGVRAKNETPIPGRISSTPARFPRSPDQHHRPQPITHHLLPLPLPQHLSPWAGYDLSLFKRQVGVTKTLHS